MLEGHLSTVFFIAKKVEKSPSLSVAVSMIRSSCEPEISVELMDFILSWGLVVKLSLLQLIMMTTARKDRIKRIGILLSNLQGNPILS